MPFDPDSPAGPSLWSFRDDVVVETGPDARLTVLSRWGEVSMDRPPGPVVDVLHRMTYGPVLPANVSGLDRDQFERVLDRLPGRVVRSLGAPDTALPLLSVQPVTAAAVLRLPAIPPEQPVRLSRFAVARLRDGVLVLESPLSEHRVVLHRPPVAAVVGALAHAVARGRLDRGLDVAPALVAEIVAYLAGAGMVVLADAQQRFAEDTDPDLVLWSPYDLLFHSRSRLGRHDEPVGATFRHVTSIPPLPEVRPVPAGLRVPMYRPDPDAPGASTMPLAEALERRHSSRVFAAAGPSARQLGELLYRAARVRSRRTVTAPGDVPVTLTSRPYPGAGAFYELELYLTVDRCPDLAAGVYHYDPDGHALTLVDGTAAAVASLLEDARVATGSVRPPPVLTTMTARVGRMSWVYDTIPYATTLQHAGVLQQTLHLVATMLGLAACSIAMGRAVPAASIAGLDWPAEVSIGEIAIGLPETDNPSHDRYPAKHYL